MRHRDRWDRIVPHHLPAGSAQPGQRVERLPQVARLKRPWTPRTPRISRLPGSVSPTLEARRPPSALPASWSIWKTTTGKQRHSSFSKIFGGAHPQPPGFWSLLTDAAHLMCLKDADWYAWRSSEARSGAIRAELCLMRTEDGGRKRPVPPRGVLRPLWDVGRLTPEGDPLLSIASLWVEGYGALEPGACASVRLLPLRPEHWQHLDQGDVITMHEMRPHAGTARIIEVMPPVGTAP